MATYSWLTKTNAVNALAARLSNSSLWVSAELWLYVSEALRHFNALCGQFNSQLALTNANGAWVNTGTQAGSPRLRSVTDVALYTQMEYMLLEPASGGTWTGSSQFTLGNLQDALQKRCQEVIQATSCNMAQLSPINATPTVRSGYALADTVLEARRNRFMALMASTTGTASSGSSALTVASAAGAQVGTVVTGTGIAAGTFATSVTGSTVGLSLPTTGAVSGTIQFYQPYFLTREDALSFQSFEPSYLQTAGIPMSWAVASEPPLSFDVDLAPNTPGYFDMLALNAGPTFDPPTASLLGLPDDWSMVAMYGALGDVLGQEAEATDRQRGAYCLQRYTQMLEMMKKSNWLTQCIINGIVADTVSLSDMDALAVNWQESNRNLPAVVEAGMDFVAPLPGNGQSVTLNLVANAPLLDVTGTYVQVSRDDWDTILNYAHHVASFKMGNQAFEATMPMLKAFYRYCAQFDSRWSTYGLFVDELRSEGRLQDEKEPRRAIKYDSEKIGIQNFLSSLSGGRG